MKTTRRIALLLALCMTLPLAACTGDVPETEETKDTADAVTDQPDTAGESGTETEAETEPPVNLYEDLGEADFGDCDFGLLFSDESQSKYALMEDYMGEPVDDAIFEANAKVMDLAKVKLVPVYAEGPMAELKVANSAGDFYFELASDHDLTMGISSLQGTMLNLYNLPHINWEGDWWPQFTLDTLTLRGTMLMISNYSSYFSSASTRAVFANMDLIDQYGLEHPHTLVNENRWTMDQFIAMTKDAGDDINGDGLMDQENDVWGFANVRYFYCYFEAWNIEIFDKTPDGQDLCLNVGEDIANIMEKMYTWFCESPGVFHTPDNLTITDEIMFRNKNSIFDYCSLGTMTRELMKTGINYAILPLPKLDETVPEYYSGCTDRPFCVPRAYPVSGYDKLGYVLEALAIAGYEKIYPAYVETALKYRYSPTEDDSEVVDMLFKNRILGFSWLYNNEQFPRMMDHLFAKDTFAYSSYIATGRKKNETWIQRLQDKLLDLGDNG